MELQIEQSVMSLRKTVHYILLQAKKESDHFRRDDLAVAIKKLTKITDTLAQATNNAPPAMQCISTAKRLAFSAMKYLQVKHSGQNFIVQETEFKKDIALFKNHYTLLMNYCEKTGWKISDSKSTTPPDTKSQTSGTTTPHHSGSHQIKKTPVNTPGQSPLVKSLSEPANARFYSESKSPEPHGLMSSTGKESPTNTTRTPPGRSSNNQTPISHGSRVRNNVNSPSHYERTQQHKRTESFDEWDSIEKELLGTIEEDNITTVPISDRPSTSIRTSIVSERSDLLELLIQQGLTAEMILNSTEEELLLVLEKSLLSDNTSLQPKTKRQSTQDLEDRLAFLEKQLLGDLF